jgi:hypothetical protein
MHKLGLCLLALAFGFPVAAQEFNLSDARLPIAELHGLARFHTGDDPHWSEPGFDDSAWPLARIDQPWSTQGFKSDSGFAWYRLKIVAPPGRPHLGFYYPHSYDCYEIFVGGQSVAKYGGMPPNPRVLQGTFYQPPVQRIPDELLPAGRPVLVALRVWHWPYWTYTPPGPVIPLSIGDAQLLETQRQLRISDNVRGVSGFSLLLVACLLGCCAGLGLFLLRPGEFEYLWFACAELGLASLAWRDSYPAAHAMDFHSLTLWGSLSYLVFDICWPTFIVRFLGQPRRLLYWTTVAFAIATFLTFIPYLFQWISAAAFIVIVFLTSTLMLTGFLLLVWIPARRGAADAKLLVVPTLLYNCANLAQGIVLLGLTLQPLSPSWWDRYNSILTWPFTFSADSLADFVTQAAVLAIVVLRFARKSRNEERLANEIESARAVQQVLVPAENPSIPGFAIEAVYKPAGAVGGDFYQTVTTPEGGVLIVIGDVSGKGMPAAMTVSLLVGTFRTLAHYTQSPGEILRAMNIRMLARTQGGFTTCMVLRVDPDGTLSAANAGHLAPYLDGSELPLENGLPLGINGASSYPELTLSLPPDARLTLITDGVVEARNAAGELFGFDRTAAIATQPAEAIAKAAQAFGQEDDITVLRLQFSPAEVIHA